MMDPAREAASAREMWTELSASVQNGWMLTWLRLAMRDRSLPILRGYLAGLRDLGASQAELSRAYQRIRLEVWPDAPSLEELEKRVPASPGSPGGSSTHSRAASPRRVRSLRRARAGPDAPPGRSP